MSKISKNDTERFLRKWMLPIAISAGILSYLIYHWCSFLHPIGPAVHKTAVTLQPLLISFMLFLQFCRISPHDLKFRQWHLWLLLLQGVVFLGLGFFISGMESGPSRILIESFMICLICPTAIAAGVITDKLGGSLSGIMSYVFLVNCMVTILIPAVIPIIHPSADNSFIKEFLSILGRLFPTLILPLAAAWTVRYTMKRLQRFLMRHTDVAFYLWGISLATSLALTTRSIILSDMNPLFIVSIGVISLISCILQFYLGHRIGARYDQETRVTAGQALGQKNTTLMIWIGYSFMSPETSLVGGLYCIWHNITNSLELLRKESESSLN